MVTTVNELMSVYYIGLVQRQKGWTVKMQKIN